MCVTGEVWSGGRRDVTEVATILSQLTGSIDFGMDLHGL